MNKNSRLLDRVATARQAGKFLPLILLAAAFALAVAACAPATAPEPAVPAAQPTVSAPTVAPVAPTATAAAPAATKAPVPTEKPAATATQPAAPTDTQAPAAKQATVSFAKDVKPIFDQSCVKCHGGEKTEDGLSLKTYEALMKGSDNGPVVKPGKADDSELIKVVVLGEMPKRAPKLADAQIKTLTDWVNAGAPNN